MTFPNSEASSMSFMPNERAGTSDCKQLVPLRKETCANSRRCSQSSSTGSFSSYSYKTPDSASGKIHGPVQNNGNFPMSSGMPSGIGLHLNSLATAMPLTCRANSQAPAKGSVNMQGMIPLSLNQALSEGQKSCLLSVSSGENMSVESSMNLAPVMVASVMEKTAMDQQELHSFGTAKIGVTKSTTCLRSLKVGIDLFEPSLPFRAVDRNYNPDGTKMSFVHDMSQQSTFGNGEDIVQNSPRRGRRKSGKIRDNGGCKRCSCKKSKCLKLYCECFAAGLYCIAPCTCQGCFNSPDHENMVQSTRQLIESHNPLAFAPKIIQDADFSQRSEEGQSETTASKRHKRGCNCKKSTCLKKYCECYQGQVGCFEGCRCEGCKNIYGKKQGMPLIA